MAEQRQPPRIKQDWRNKDGAAPGRGPTSSRRRQLFAVLYGFLALAGVTVAVVLLWRPLPKLEFLPLFITQYSHLPPNALAEQDQEALCQHFAGGTVNRLAEQERDRFRRLLDDLKSKKPEGPVVLYLSAHVLADAKGELFVLPADAKADNPDTWVALHRLIEGMVECPSQKKLLVLDVMKPWADPRLGVLADDAAGRVIDAVKEAVKDKGLLVLCACDRGQVAHTSEYLGQSVFGYYFDEALRGWAPGRGPERKVPNRVSVQELYGYVRDHVDGWARHHRQAPQTPCLIGAGADFDLAVLDPRSPDERDEPAEVSYPPWLADAWRARDAWEQRAVYREAPLAYRQLEAAALRAEQQWRGGVKDTTVQDNLKKDRAEMERQAEAVRSALGALAPKKPRSLALALAGQKPPDDKAVEAVNDLSRVVERLSGAAKPDEAAKTAARKEFVGKFKDKPLDRLWSVMQAAATKPQPRREFIQFLYHLVTPDLQPPQPEYVETLFLYRLNKLSEDTARDPRLWSDKAVHQGLRAVQEGEKVAAWDPRALPWVRDRLLAADQQRHQGEVMLFSPGFASADEAAKVLEGAAGEYEKINDDLQTVAHAYRVRDEALALLPGLAPYLTDRPQGDRKGWQDVVKALLELSRALEQVPGSPEQGRDLLGQLRQQAPDLERQLRALRKPFTAEDVKELLQQATRADRRQSVLQEIDLRLKAACLKAADRENLWKTKHQLEEELQKDLPPPEPGSAAKRADAPDPRAEQERAAFRAEVAIDLLRLGGLSGAAALQAKLEKARRADGKANAWPALAAELRQDWAAHLVEQIKEQGKDEAALAVLDRRSRAIHPSDVAAAFADASQAPSARFALRCQQDQRRWLGGRFQDEQQEWRELAAKRDDVIDKFYEGAAGDYPDGPSAGVQLLVAGPPLDLRERSEGTVRVNIRADAKADAALKYLKTDDGWLRVADGGQKPPGRGEWEFRLTVTPGPDSGAPQPTGFLIAARVSGRTFFRQVPVFLAASRAKLPQLLLADSDKVSDAARSAPRLRPNTPQALFVFVKNPDDQPRKVAVEWQAAGLPGDAIRADVEVPAGETKLVPFKLKPAAGDKPLDLKGPLVLRLLDKDGKELDQPKPVELDVRPARDYVDCKPPTYDPVKGTLSIGVRVLPNTISGPDCPVRLVLRKDRISGLICDGPELVFEAALPAAGGEYLPLTITGLRFDDDRADEKGLVYVTVDGYDRAFGYAVSFANQPSDPAPLRGRTVRLVMPDAVATDGPGAAPVTVEVDRADPAARLRLEISRRKDGGPWEILGRKDNAGGRDRQVQFLGGADGGLLFQVSVKDWQFRAKVQHRRDKWWMRAVLTDRDDKDGRRALVDPKEVVFDDSPPADVRLVSVGDAELHDNEDVVKVVRAKALRVRAAGGDAESGIGRVRFFFGKPVKDQPPPDARVVRGVRRGDVWEAELPLTPDEKGAVTLTAQFVNGVGLSKFAKASVELTQPAPPKTTIRGKVTMNGVPQKDARVWLLDPKTNMVLYGDRGLKVNPDNGEYVFADVKPRDYLIYAVGLNEQDKGQAQVEVKASEVVSKDIAIGRFGR
jgi:hypothetical protein